MTVSKSSHQARITPTAVFHSRLYGETHRSPYSKRIQWCPTWVCDIHTSDSSLAQIYNQPSCEYSCCSGTAPSSTVVPASKPPRSNFATSKERQRSTIPHRFEDKQHITKQMFKCEHNIKSIFATHRREFSRQDTRFFR